MTSGAVYTTVLAFVLINAILFWHGVLIEAKQHSNFKRYTTVIARGCGYMLNFNIPLLLLMGSKSFMTALRKTPLNVLIPFDHAMPAAHISLGYICFISAALHGFFHLVPGIIAGSWKAGFLKWTYAVCTGLFLFCTFSVMVFFARKKVRESKFEVFYYVHILGATVFIGVLFIHGILFEKLYTYKWIAPAVAVYVLDRLFRKVRETKTHITVPASGSLAFADGNILRLSIPRCMHYTAGQWADICIPAVSRLEWHPFTIASSPLEDHMIFFVKQNGDWTNKLGLLLSERKGMAGYTKPDKNDMRIQCVIRGPYGAPAQHVGQYDKVVLISGGVGSTPFASIVKDVVIHNDGLSRSCASDVSRITGGKGCRESESILQHDNYAFGRGHVVPSSTPGPSQGSLNNLGRELSQMIADQRSNGTTISTSTCSRSPSDMASASTNTPDDSFDAVESDWRCTVTLRKFYYGLTSTTVTFLILWLTLIRFFLLLLAVIIEEGVALDDYVALKVLPFGFQIADLALSSIVMVLSVSAIVLQIIYSRREMNPFFIAIDLLVVIPILIIPVAFHILYLFGAVQDNRAIYAYAFYYVIWPLTPLAILIRHVRNAQGNSVLADNVRSSSRKFSSLDFLYTTKDSKSDDWLISEIQPYTRSPCFRVYRFLTRESPDEEQCLRDSRAIHTHYGRPNWKHVIGNLISNVKSGSSVGVFFCGPRAMEVDVREACYLAMVRSRRKGMICRQNKIKMETPSHDDAYGCNVRLVVRAENF